MKYFLFLLLLICHASAYAQGCDELVARRGNHISGRLIPVYIHVEGVCPDDTLLLYAVRDSDKLYLTGMPSECRTPQCEYIIRRSYYDITFADGSTYRYHEPYLTNYSSDELFIMLQGQVVARRFKKKTYKAVCQYITTDIGLVEKMLRTPVKSIQVYNATPRRDWGDTDYKLEYFPGSRLSFSTEGAQVLMRIVQCLAQ